MERGSIVGSTSEERLEANDVYWLEVSLFPCSEASADHITSEPCYTGSYCLTLTWIAFGLQLVLTQYRTNCGKPNAVGKSLIIREVCFQER